MSVPDSIVYVQRRNDHRVQLAGRSNFRGHLDLNKNILVTGYAADISLHGLGVVLKIPNKITQGDKLFSCILQLEDEVPLYFDLTVCFVQKIPQRGSTRIGCQFDKLDNEKGIHVYVDLKSLKPGVYIRRATITLPVKTTLIGVKPEIFTVKIMNAKKNN